jgi:hypothetical protein
VGSSTTTAGITVVELVVAATVFKVASVVQSAVTTLFILAFHSIPPFSLSSLD